jgi:hypothetical protein
MTHIGGARYIAQSVVLPQSGKFRLHIEPVLPVAVIDVPSANDNPLADLPSGWRLISQLTGFSESDPINITAPDIEKVFTRAQLQ